MTEPTPQQVGNGWRLLYDDEVIQYARYPESDYWTGLDWENDNGVPVYARMSHSQWFVRTKLTREEMKQRIILPT